MSNKSAEYRAYSHMHRRCTKPKDRDGPNYIANGISICDRWKTGQGYGIGYRNFLADMGNRPSPKHSLDRINNKLGYSPENCRWATTFEQMRNTGRRREFTVLGETDCGSVLAQKHKISIQTVYMRLSLGWSEDDAFTLPRQNRWSGPASHK